MSLIDNPSPSGRYFVYDLCKENIHWVCKVNTNCTFAIGFLQTQCKLYIDRYVYKGDGLSNHGGVMYEKSAFSDC